MMNRPIFLAALAALCGILFAGTSQAQVAIGEDFTGPTTRNSWYFFNGACLTASSNAASGSPGQIPGCTAIKSTYYNEALVGGQNGLPGAGQTLPDPNGQGALRFTNGCIPDGSGGCGSGGHGQNGAIVSAIPFPTDAGVQITFKTVTYRGDSGSNSSSGSAKLSDGADGISFFLTDASVAPNIGSWGGSLGYTCSNSNSDYHGMVGAYLGLGIDEFGNFLNGTGNTLGTSATQFGDNTASGGGQWANRIGMRGAGNVAWSWLNAQYPTLFPSTWSASNQNAAVKNTCASGVLRDYNNNPLKIDGNTVPVLDYQAIPNAWKVLSGVTIANEYSNRGYARTDASPILYNLKVTQDGLLSLAYSFNGGAWTNVITNRSITASNGALPANFLFGFAGSTGGASNIHEILCFKAAPVDQSASSATTNEKQSSKVESGTQAYFSFYDPNNWTGRLAAYGLGTDSAGNLTIATAANWDAACVLTGVATGAHCPTTGAAGYTAAQGSAARTILSWSGTAGIPFQWGSLSTAEQGALDPGNSSSTSARLSFLRGDRSNEMTSLGVGLFRARAGVLSDIVDSSATWVGPPSSPYTSTWMDRLNPGAVMPENSGTSYQSFSTSAANQTRTNVAYVGANDGMLHGFRAGSFSGKTYVATQNDGTEVLAYMPAAVINAIHNTTDSSLDFSNTQYGHNFYVNATPGSGDLYYASGWHTWLVGGLGSGGTAIYALDITTPTSFNEGNAATLVMGEWDSTTISCPATTNCGNRLGNTYGTPIIRRLHSGDWAVIFGNGIGSASGDAGIFIMVVDHGTAAKTFYYLSTGQAGSNGIANVTSADLDGDHVVDYVYAGDLRGNVWRFDLTSATPSNWAASTAPLFTASSGQPITSQVMVDLLTGPLGGPFGPTQVMVAFGTGRKYPLTNASATSYASGTQDIYAFWDWNMASWNAKSTAKFASLTTAASGLTTPYTIKPANLQKQTVTIDASSGDRRIDTVNPICWASTSTCSSGNTALGWYLDLPGGSEQVIYNPQIVTTAFSVNTIAPASNSLLSCSTSLDKGFTYAISMFTGGPVPGFFVNNGNTHTIAFEGDATGTSAVVTTTPPPHAPPPPPPPSDPAGPPGGPAGSGGGGGGGGGGGSCTPGTNTWFVYQTVAGTPSQAAVAPACNIAGIRRTWIQLR